MSRLLYDLVRGEQHVFLRMVWISIILTFFIIGIITGALIQQPSFGILISIPFFLLGFLVGIISFSVIIRTTGILDQSEDYYD